ncbi:MULTISPECIES: hypothetical protein [unclassified Bartonella]|uniref:hypothetical protein n=1 Tax=unclassified Bartonella TaxID=2645622 RepID=UPI0035D0DDE3
MGTGERYFCPGNKGSDHECFIGQRSENNSRSLFGPKVEKMIFAAVALLLGKLVFKAAGVFKRWAGAKISHAFEEWRGSYYH